MSRLKTQTKLHDPENGVEGNCTQAAFATLLGLELDEVPDFNTLHQHKEHSGWFWNHLHRWLRSKGYNLRATENNFCPNGLYLADGPSPRGVSHFVVMQNGVLYHDPHPSRAGLLEIKRTWTIYPIDPALMQPVPGATFEPDEDFADEF